MNENGHFLEKNIISSFLFWADCEYHLTSYAGVSADMPADYLLGNRNYGKIMNRPAMLKWSEIRQYKTIIVWRKKTMQNFEFYAPTRMIFGKDTHKQVESW